MGKLHTDMIVVPTQEIFFHLTIDEIYKDAKTTESPTFPLNFHFFSEVDEEIFKFLIPQVIAKHSHPDIFVFMVDHSYNKFGHFDFCGVYQLFFVA